LRVPQPANARKGEPCLAGIVAVGDCDLAALLVGAVPLYARFAGIEGSVPPGLDLVFGMIWAVGIASDLAAAHQAKFHRLRRSSCSETSRVES
jgi:hypothetical protein